MKWARVETNSGEIVYVTPSGPNQWDRLEGSPLDGWTLTGEETEVARFLAPVDAPMVIGMAVNYPSHAPEMNTKPPTRPVFFLKMFGALTAHGETIALPRHQRSDKVDYEAELAVILGKDAKNVPAEEAEDYILGYTCANDLTARDWQKEWGGGQFCRGKGFDGFCPLGPIVVGKDEIQDPHALKMEGFLNGDRKQVTQTGEMIFRIPQIIEFLSGSSTLPAGTVILTGTPSGVGSGQNPPRFLQPGDEYEVRIEGIGSLVNRFVEEIT